MRYALLLWMVVGCAVDHTGLIPSEPPLVPDAAQQDAAQPDGGSDAAQPDAAQPDATQPDAAQPDAAQPDGGPDASTPDAGRPDAGSDGGPDAGPPDCPVGFERDATGNCANIDDCAPNPCMNGGSCEDGIATFTCACAPGFAGGVCATNIDDCSPNPCMNGGVCTDGVDAFVCSCPVEFVGDTCSTANPEAELAFYNPLGPQGGTSALPVTDFDPRIVASAFECESNGAASGFSNTNRKPVLMSAGPLDPDTSFYVTLTLTPSAGTDAIALSRVTYFYASYESGATGTISARTSADGFATTVDSVAWTGATAELVSFDMSSVPVSGGALEVRLYMHDRAGTSRDWADLVSTFMARGDGMRVFGRVVAE